MKHVVVCVRTIHQLYSQSIRLKWILAFSLSVVLGSVTGLTSTVALAELPAAQDPGALVFDNIPAPEPKGPTNVIHSGPNTEILREVSENSEQIIRFTYQIQNSSSEFGDNISDSLASGMVVRLRIEVVHRCSIP